LKISKISDIFERKYRIYITDIYRRYLLSIIEPTLTSTGKLFHSLTALIKQVAIWFGRMFTHRPNVSENCWSALLWFQQPWPKFMQAYLSLAAPSATENARVVRFQTQFLQPRVFRFFDQKAWHRRVEAGNLRWLRTQEVNNAATSKRQQQATSHYNPTSHQCTEHATTRPLTPPADLLLLLTFCSIFSITRTCWPE